MSHNPLADEVWRAMASLVIDNRDSWKRAVVEHSGLPFSRIRVLRRLVRRPDDGQSRWPRRRPWTRLRQRSRSTTSRTAGWWYATPIRPIGAARWCR